MAGPARVPLSDGENLAVGALGGVIETCLQMPLITYKICVQEGRPTPSTAAGWYRGVGANAASLAPITAVQVAANGALERVVTGGTRQMSDAETIGVAMGAGAVSAVIYGPVDLTVIQQQKLEKGPLETVRAVSGKYGAQMMFRGFASTVVREAIYTAGYLGLAPLAKTYLQQASPWFQERDLTSSIVGSCIGGTVAAMLTHPVDTAKTCIQADLEGKTFTSATRAVQQVYAEKGIGGLYKGGAARTLRLCGAFFVISNLREYAIQYKSKLAAEE